MIKFRKLLKKQYIPYNDLLLISHRNGQKYYCERKAHAIFQSSYEKSNIYPKRKKGKYILQDGVWNLYPDEEPIVGLINWKDIIDWEVVSTPEDYEKYKAYQLKYFKEHPIEMYLPSRRSTLTKEFLEWINLPNVQLTIRNWVDGYGYSDAYNWENPDILMEYIYKSAAKIYGGKSVLNKMEEGMW